MKYLLVAVVFFGLGWFLLKGVEQPTAPSSNEDKVTSPVEQILPPAGGSIEVYDGVSVPKNSTTLDLSGRGLTGSLKAEVRELSQLEVLDISNNNFTGLPAEVGQLSKLRVVNLSNNPFTGLPYELGDLQNLETLDLRGTDYALADLDVIKESLPDTTEILTD